MVIVVTSDLVHVEVAPFGGRQAEEYAQLEVSRRVSCWKDNFEITRARKKLSTMKMKSRKFYTFYKLTTFL